jgi:hypothetical protein
MEVTPHALQAVQVRLKSVNNEGHFTLEAETVFRMYLLTNCCGFTQISHIALYAFTTRSAIYVEVGQ